MNFAYLHMLTLRSSILISFFREIRSTNRGENSIFKIINGFMNHSDSILVIKFSKILCNYFIRSLLAIVGYWFHDREPYCFRVIQGLITFMCIHMHPFINFIFCFILILILIILLLWVYLLPWTWNNRYFINQWFFLYTRISTLKSELNSSVYNTFTISPEFCVINCLKSILSIYSFISSYIWISSMAQKQSTRGWIHVPQDL